MTPQRNRTKAAHGLSPRTGKTDKTASAGSLDKLVTVAEGIGKLAIAGTALGAVALGVGYLAVKQHDEMLGLISTTSYVLYVRTGVEFLPRTLYAITLYFGERVGRIAILGGLVILASLISGFFSRKKSWPWLYTQTRRVAVLVPVILAVLLFVAGTRLLRWQLQPLEPINQNLLLLGYRPEFEKWPSGAAEVYRLLHRPAIDTLELRAGTPSASSQLLIKYGERALVVAVFVYVTVFVARIKRQDGRGKSTTRWGGATEDEPTLAYVSRRWLATPLLYLLCAMMLLSLPLLYGVLAVSNTLPCVILNTPNLTQRHEAELPSLALSDLSGDVNDVVLFRWTTSGRDSIYALERVNAKSVIGVIGGRCEGNLLAQTVLQRQLVELSKKLKAAKQAADARKGVVKRTATLTAPVRDTARRPGERRLP